MKFDLSARVLKIATSGQRGDRWFKLRHAIADPRRILAALRFTSTAKVERVALDERIVVIGTGFASLAFIRQLTAAGYRDITVVSRDDLFGGKCVNFGCMPTEFVLSQRHLPPEKRRDALHDFVAGMRGDVADQFSALGWPVVGGQVSRIVGSVVEFEDGTELPFERLAVAMGSRYPDPVTAATISANRVLIESFWALAPGTRIVIDAHENVAALGLAEAARSLGLQPTVLLGKGTGLGKLPSFRHLLRRIAATGTVVHTAARTVRVDAERIVIEVNGKTKELPYDCLLDVGIPSPTLPTIDGQQLAVYDLDFKRAAWSERPDIAFLGDSAGFFTASEAEAQAKMVARLWRTGTAIDLDTLRAMPVSIDGPEPLCMAGAPWTLLRSEWIELDFRAIGWSKVHGQEGKLWYLLNPATAMVEAIHICHAHAKELIALARVLMNHRVDDDLWLSTALHPTASEIFLVLAENARSRMPTASLDNAATVPSQATAMIYRLPVIDDLSPGGALPDWLSRNDAAEALLLPDPRRRLAESFAVAHLMQGIAGDPARHGDDMDQTVTVTFDAGGRCEARQGIQSVLVEF